MKKIFYILTATLPYLALADTAPAPIKSVSDLTSQVCIIGGYVFGIAIAISVVIVIYGGFLYMTSGGEEDKIKKAKDTLTYAAVGIAVAIISVAVPNLVGFFLGNQGTLGCS